MTNTSEPSQNSPAQLTSQTLEPGLGLYAKYHYNKLAGMILSFKPFLSPKVKFEWNTELNEAFQKPKLEIVHAIENGVEIYDLLKDTCLRPD